MTAIDFAAHGETASRAQALMRWMRALSALLALSSASAALAQLAWQPAFVRSFGEGAALVTIAVVASGLGLGSLIGGVLTRWRIAPLPLLSLFAAASAGLVALADDLGGWNTVVAPPFASAALMGAIMPLAIGQLARRAGTVGSAFSEVVFVAMLGAGAACLAYGAVLAPVLGGRGTLGILVTLNALVALAALVVHWRDRSGAMPADVVTAWRQPLIAFVLVLALAALSGLLALASALFFVRIVSHAAASSMATAGSVVFTATLAAFLVGLAAGARRAGQHCALFSAEELMRRTARGAMAATLVALAALPLLNQLAWLDRAVIGVAMLLAYLSARGWGALMPYLAELGLPKRASAGPRGALVLLAHVAGAASGALVTALVPPLSLVAVGVVLVVAGVGFTLLLVAVLDLPRWQKIVRAITAATVAVLALALMPRWSQGVLEAFGKNPVTQTIETKHDGTAVKG